MDTKELWQKAINELEHLNRTLDKFLKITHGSKSHRTSSDNDDDAEKENDNTNSRAPLAIPNLGPRPQQTPTPGHHWYQPKYYVERPYNSFWKPRVEVATFIFAVVYASVAFMQWKDANSNFKVQQRAFVYVKEIFIVGDGELPTSHTKDKPAYITVTLENSGPTPARNETLELDFCGTTLELPADFAYPHLSNTNAPTLVAPKGTPQISVPITEDTLQDVEFGRTNLFVYGTARYQDIFGDGTRLSSAIGTKGLSLTLKEPPSLNTFLVMAKNITVTTKTAQCLTVHLLVLKGPTR
jgi:hypothetical protein